MGCASIDWMLAVEENTFFMRCARNGKIGAKRGNQPSPPSVFICYYFASNDTAAEARGGTSDMGSVAELRESGLEVCFADGVM